MSSQIPSSLHVCDLAHTLPCTCTVCSLLHGGPHCWALTSDPSGAVPACLSAATRMARSPPSLGDLLLP